jgi:hypothetical protein
MMRAARSAGLMKIRRTRRGLRVSIMGRREHRAVVWLAKGGAKCATHSREPRLRPKGPSHPVNPRILRGARPARFHYFRGAPTWSTSPSIGHDMNNVLGGGLGGLGVKPESDSGVRSESTTNKK